MYANQFKEKLNSWVNQCYADYTFITSQKHISDYEYETRVNIFIAFYGSGKTQSLINHYLRTKQTFIFVCPRRSLVNDVCARLRKKGIEVFTHTELNKKGILHHYTGNIVTTLESLTKIELHNHKDSIFIFDETATILKQMFSRIDDDRQLAMMDSLQAICRNCKCAFFDANLDKNEIDLLHEISGKPFQKDFSIVSNSEYQPPKRKVKFFTNDGQFQETFLSLVGSGKKILMMIDNKSRANEFDYILKESDFKSVVLSSDTRKDILENNTINDFVQAEQPQVLFVTPTGFVGLDIPDNYFDAIFTYSDNIGLTDYREYLQSAFRERNFELPIYDYTKPIERSIVLKIDWLDILSDMQADKTEFNRIARTYTDQDLFKKVEPRFQPFEVYLAKVQADINLNLKKGLLQYKTEYYNHLGYSIEFIKTECTPLQIDSIKETAEEKRDRLKLLPLVDKKEFDVLRKKEAYTDLTLEEKSIKSKYELAENLKIGLTDVSRKYKLDKIYDYSVNDETLANLSKRISTIIQPDLQAEIDFNTKRGIIFRHESIFLECEVFKKLYSELKDRSFTKVDIDDSIIKDIQTLRKHSESFEFRDQILKTTGFIDLMEYLKPTIPTQGIREQLAIEYAYHIASGDIETITSVYKDKLESIRSKIDTQLIKEIDRIKTRSTNQKTIEKNIYKKMMQAEIKTIEFQKKFIKQIQSDFKISSIKIVSNFLSYFGIKLVEVERETCGARNRIYKIDSDRSVFEILTSFSSTRSN
ncbi:MAG: DEAD/DEAH box helicase family protein [Leptospiraceae bacterium]|nr:DEAD/DEAH box helicase family protein [Leptospiraceae bacterium]